MFDNHHRTKFQVEVELHLDEGDIFLGKLSLLPDQRSSDLMNDERQFLPFNRSDGLTIILRKSTISKIIELDQSDKEVEQSDPYEVLGVSPEISNPDLAKAYRIICAQNHPDKIQASGLSASYIQIANSRMIRINDAYRRILNDRQKKDAAESN